METKKMYLSKPRDEVPASFKSMTRLLPSVIQILTLLIVFLFMGLNVTRFVSRVILRACLHGVWYPGLVGLVSFVFTLWRTQNKRNLPH